MISTEYSQTTEAEFLKKSDILSCFYEFQPILGYFSAKFNVVCFFIDFHAYVCRMSDIWNIFYILHSVEDTLVGIIHRTIKQKFIYVLPQRYLFSRVLIFVRTYFCENLLYEFIIIYYINMFWRNFRNLLFREISENLFARNFRKII